MCVCLVFFYKKIKEIRTGKVYACLATLNTFHVHLVLKIDIKKFKKRGRGGERVTPFLQVLLQLFVEGPKAP